MKKIYKMPLMDVIDVRIENQLCAGSSVDLPNSGIQDPDDFGEGGSSTMYSSRELDDFDF